MARLCEITRNGDGFYLFDSSPSDTYDTYCAEFVDTRPRCTAYPFGAPAVDGGTFTDERARQLYADIMSVPEEDRYDFLAALVAMEGGKG
jgi:hypothetical protein